MSLIKTGGGVTDIRGGFGGVYFTRDKSGLHSSAKPRRVRQRSSAQNAQRNAFIKARAFCKNERFTDKPKDWLNRCVSYNIYRALNGLDVGFFATVTGDLTPDATGTFELAGTHEGKDYYKRKDGAWFIWFAGEDRYYMTPELGHPSSTQWGHNGPTIEGEYYPEFDAFGIATVTLFSTEPPTDYQIPKL